MLPIRWVFIRPHDVLGTVDASHLVDIGSRSEGLVKQTQYMVPPQNHRLPFMKNIEGERTGEVLNLFDVCSREVIVSHVAFCGTA